MINLKDVIMILQDSIILIFLKISYLNNNNNNTSYDQNQNKKGSRLAHRTSFDQFKYDYLSYN